MKERGRGGREGREDSPLLYLLTTSTLYTKYLQNRDVPTFYIMLNGYYFKSRNLYLVKGITETKNRRSKISTHLFRTGLFKRHEVGRKGDILREGRGHFSGASSRVRKEVA